MQASFCWRIFPGIIPAGLQESYQQTQGIIPADSRNHTSRLQESYQQTPGIIPGDSRNHTNRLKESYRKLLELNQQTPGIHQNPGVMLADSKNHTSRIQESESKGEIIFLLYSELSVCSLSALSSLSKPACYTCSVCSLLGILVFCLPVSACSCHSSSCSLPSLLRDSPNKAAPYLLTVLYLSSLYCFLSAFSILLSTCFLSVLCLLPTVHAVSIQLGSQLSACSSRPSPCSLPALHRPPPCSLPALCLLSACSQPALSLLSACSLPSLCLLSAKAVNDTRDAKSRPESRPRPRQRRDFFLGFMFEPRNR